VNVLILLAAILVGADAPTPSDSKSSQQEARTVTAEACLQHAFEAARAIQDGSVRRGLLEWIGRDQACAGDLAGARRVVEVIEDHNEAAMVLAAVAEFQVKRGDRDAAKETLAEALKRGDRVEPQQRRELVTRIVEGYVAAGDLDQALTAASRFPDELDRTYAKIKIAEAHLAAGRHSEAGKFVHEAVAAYRTNSSDYMFQNMASTLWPLYLKLGEVAAALELARAIPARKYDRCRALCEIGEHQAKAGNAKAASAALAEALEAAQKIEGLDGVIETHMTWVVHSQIAVGDVGGASKTLQRMPDGYFKALALGDTAIARAKEGNRAVALSTMKEAVEVARRIQDEGSKAQTLAPLAQSWSQMGEKAAARETAAQAFKAACEVDYEGALRALCFTQIAEAQTQIGDRAGAQRTLDEAVRRARENSNTEDKFEELRDIAKAQIALGFPKQAGTIVREVLLPLLPLKGAGSDGCVDAARLLAQAGDFAGGYEAAKKVGGGASFRAYGMQIVAAYQTMAQGSAAALTFAEKESNPVLRCGLYHGIALGLLKVRGVEAPSYRWIAPLN
jgi:tetratricopeptide (TPR) repeat protein